MMTRIWSQASTTKQNNIMQSSLNKNKRGYNGIFPEIENFSNYTLYSKLSFLL